MRRDVVARHHTAAAHRPPRCLRLRPPHVAASEQPAEIGVARVVGRPEHERSRVDGFEIHADDQLQTHVFGRGMRPHDAGERALVGDRERFVTERMRPPHQFLGMRCPFEKREIARAAQFRIPRPDVIHSIHRTPPLRKHAMQKPAAVTQPAKQPEPLA